MKPMICILLTVAAAMELMAGPSIAITNAEATFPDRHTIRVHLAAEGEKIAVGSYGIRAVSKDLASPAGFRRHSGYAFFAVADKDDDHWYLLLDNETGDVDPAAGAVAADIDVSEWDDGQYDFLVFACNRPAGGDYVDDRRFFLITVKDGKAIREATFFRSNVNVQIGRLDVRPAIIDDGETVTVKVRITAEGVSKPLLRITVPYTVGPKEYPPGFHYVPERKMAYLAEQEPFVIADNGPMDSDGEANVFELQLPTAQWEPGVTVLTAEASAEIAPDTVFDYRDFAITVRPENPKIAVRLSHDQRLKSGTHFRLFCPLDDGSVLAYGRVTDDGGRTWKQLPDAGHLGMATQLKDGTIIGLGSRTKPIDGRAGYYTATVYESTDGGETSRRVPSELYMPRATSGVGHAYAAGPIFWGHIVELPGGALLASMYGWFEGDESPVPGQPRSFYYRSMLVRSDDRGRNWKYVSTIGYDPNIGTEGYCEPSMRLLPNDDLLCMLRTGGNSRPHHQDNPLCVTRSSDMGKTWQEPVRTGFEGVDPDLWVMHDGTLVCSTGRPGAQLIFSHDNGHTWTDAVSINPERYSGYTAVCEVAPDVLLVGYGAKDWFNPKTGNREDQLRTVRVNIQRPEDGG